jgi:Domain of unknown function (DUF4150)
MGCDVYANGDEIACKAGSGKVIASFPDVCLTPPPPPAGPIPVPYPDTSFSKDMQNGSKTVMIEGQEVMLKDQSFYKTSPLGDEAATNGQGAGVVTHVITGKTYFVAWSMDVKFEDQNVDRHTDVTTSNHACDPANDAVPNLNAAKPAPPGVDCEKVKQEKGPVESYEEQAPKCQAGQGAYKGTQSHHVIQNAHFQEPRKTTLDDICPGYSEQDAPCIPLKDATDTNTQHGRVSQMQREAEVDMRASGKNPTYSEARANSKKQLTEPKPGPAMTDDEAECILIEVDKYFRKVCGGKADPELRIPRTTWEGD